jgi:hypothetical protein
MAARGIGMEITIAAIMPRFFRFFGWLMLGA